VGREEEGIGRKRIIYLAYSDTILHLVLYECYVLDLFDPYESKGIIRLQVV